MARAETLAELAEGTFLAAEMERLVQRKANKADSLTDTELERLSDSDTFVAHAWPRLAAGAILASRAAAAQAAATAAAAWATTALGLEAKAEASAARVACQPAAEHASLAVEWEAAAAALRAAFAQLELAKLADPGSTAMQEAEQAMWDKRGFKQVSQGPAASCTPQDSPLVGTHCAMHLPYSTACRVANVSSTRAAGGRAALAGDRGGMHRPCLPPSCSCQPSPAAQSKGDEALYTYALAAVSDAVMATTAVARAEAMAEMASDTALDAEMERLEQCEANETGSLTETVLDRLQDSELLLVAQTWPRLAAGAIPASRAATAEASAAAAAAWATTALGLEAKAEASAARAACQPAADHACLELEAVAAAWRAAFTQLELAKQADAGSTAVQEAEEAILEKRGFNKLRRQFNEQAGTS